jgi:hypothetical protein
MAGTDEPMTADRRDAVVDAVEADVLTGFEDVLTPIDFAVTGPFADREVLAEGPFAVVAWTFTGIDNGRGFNNMWPTAKRVTVFGLTIVDTSAGDEAEGWEFHRHIDWNGVNAQLGGSQGRTTAPLLVKKSAYAVDLAELSLDADPDYDGYSGRTR